MNPRTTDTAAKRVARGGLLFALALVLSMLEGAVALPVPVPGIRLGLSNIVVMYCVFSRGFGTAYLLCALKSLFVLLTRGLSAALLSLAGGVLSVTAMLLLPAAFRGEPRYTLISMAGAVFHNLGQLACAVFLLGFGTALWYYLPVLAAAGVVTGALTAVLLKLLIPALNRISGSGG